MKEALKFFLEKLAAPLLVAIVGAACVAYFISDRPAGLVLERVVLSDSSTEGVNRVGSWYLRSVSSDQRDELVPLFRNIATSPTSVAQERYFAAVERIWRSNPADTPTATAERRSYCAGLGDEMLRPEAEPHIWPEPGFDTLEPNHPLFGDHQRTNSLGISLYSIDWNLDDPLPITDAQSARMFGIPSNYVYPSELSNLEEPPTPAPLSSRDPEIHCTALRSALMERLIARSDQDQVWQVKGPLLDLTIRNRGRQAATITTVTATPVWNFVHDCGPGGTAIRPVVAPVILPIDTRSRTQVSLPDPVHLDGGDTARLQVIVDIAHAERGCGTRVVFDVEIEFFDGSTTRSMLVGRFAMGTLAGTPL